MFTLSSQCPRQELKICDGKGTVKLKELATKEQLYNHASLFSHIVVDPGCSIGYHTHEHETEFYYILRGEAVFNDNNEKETVLHAGDITATGFGQGHSLENCTCDPVELIALIVTE